MIKNLVLECMHAPSTWSDPLSMKTDGTETYLSNESRNNARAWLIVGRTNRRSEPGCGMDVQRVVKSLSQGG